MKSEKQLSDFTFSFHFHALEKEMATQSNVLDWRIPGNGEPGGLSSMGSHRVGHNWNDLAAAALLMGFPGGPSGKEPTCQRRDVRDGGLIPGSERSPGAGKGNPL